MSTVTEAGLLTSREIITGDELGSVPLATSGAVLSAARRAAAAAPRWAATPAAERAAILSRAADLLLERAQEAQDLLVREGGSITGKAFYEVHAGAAELRHAAELATAPQAPHGPGSDPAPVASPERRTS
ncbi:aldehyde dehydrogenase family protein [Streptomyces sp. NPDC048430]|uniref:aldehyde dehydrogenase family protein n=1 Tax=Streptomyces sp. NPDC048430 TaxID=3155388 RepID=UPI00342CA8D0